MTVALPVLLSTPVLASDLVERYREATGRLIGEALVSEHAYNRLADLCDTVGHRLSGSPRLDRAIEWAVKALEEDGFANVHTESVMVPVWVRGEERCTLIEPFEQDMPMLGLGMSVGTPGDGIEAEVVVASTFEELDELHSAGVRGLRFNLVDVADKKAELPMTPLLEMAERIKRLGWHLELLIHVDDYPNLDDMLGDLDVDIVVGHLGYFRPDRSVDDEGFRALLRLMHNGRCWTKLTGPYRISSGDLPYTGTSEFAQELVRTAPERVLWGSDWPHVMVKKAMPNDGALLDLLFDWVPDADLRHGILVSNPATLYEF